MLSWTATPRKNLEAFETVVRCDEGMPASATARINHPVDRDPVCGYTGIIGDVCPRCGRREGEGVPLSKLQKLGLYKNYNSTTIGYHGDPAGRSRPSAQYIENRQKVTGKGAFYHGN